MMLKVTVKDNLESTMHLVDTLCRSLTADDNDVPQGDYELASIILSSLESTLFVMREQEQAGSKKLGEHLLELAETLRICDEDAQILKKAALILSENLKETA